MKFTNKRPRYSGIYLTKNHSDEFLILCLIYSPSDKSWSISDYPDMNADIPLEEIDEGINWGPRLSKNVFESLS